MDTTDDIKAKVKNFILSEFLPDEDPDSLTDETALISDGILDSIATIKLVSFLEEQFGVSLAAHELSADYLDSVNAIAEIVQSKRRTG